MPGRIFDSKSASSASYGRPSSRGDVGSERSTSPGATRARTSWRSTLSRESATQSTMRCPASRNSRLFGSSFGIPQFSRKNDHDGVGDRRGDLRGEPRPRRGDVPERIVRRDEVDAEVEGELEERGEEDEALARPDGKRHGEDAEEQRGPEPRLIQVGDERGEDLPRLRQPLDEARAERAADDVGRQVVQRAQDEPRQRERGGGPEPQHAPPSAGGGADAGERANVTIAATSGEASAPASSRATSRNASAHATKRRPSQRSLQPPPTSATKSYANGTSSG